MAAKLRDRSIILVKWQALLDTENTMWVGLHLGDQIVHDIRAAKCPIQLDLPGRKQTRNIQPYYTFIGRDAIDALTEYFEKERGWPRKGEPIWINNRGHPMNGNAWCALWTQLTCRIGLRPKERAHDSGARYGYNTHEMRDAARSLLHLKGKKDGLDQTCTELWLGHEIDPLHYNKFYLDRDYVRSQYMIAEKYLNIVSNPQPSAEKQQQQEQEIAELREDYRKLAELVAAIRRGEVIVHTPN